MHNAAWIACHIVFLILDTIFVNRSDFLRVLDVGSADVNGNQKDAIRTSGFHDLNYEYIGLDMVLHDNVDIVVPYGTPLSEWPIDENSLDVIVSSSCFEHDDFYWETFAHMSNLLKIGGYIVLIVPSNADIHRFPVDNWRFLPDSAHALAKWANKKYLINITVVISTFAPAHTDDDIVMVFHKDRLYPLNVNEDQLEHTAISTEVKNQDFTNFLCAYVYNIIHLYNIINIPVTTHFKERLDKAGLEHYLEIDMRNSISDIDNGSDLAAKSKYPLLPRKELRMNTSLLQDIMYKYITFNIHCRGDVKEFVEPKEYLQLEHIIYKLHVSDLYCTLILNMVIPNTFIRNSTALKEMLTVVSSRLKFDDFYSKQIYNSLLSALNTYAETMLI